MTRTNFTKAYNETKEYGPYLPEVTKKLKQIPLFYSTAFLFLSKYGLTDSLFKEGAADLTKLSLCPDFGFKFRLWMSIALDLTQKVS